MLTRAQAHKNTQEDELAGSLFASVLSKEEIPSGVDLMSCTLQEPEEIAEPVPDAAVPLPLTCGALIEPQQSDPSLAVLDGSYPKGQL